MTHGNDVGVATQHPRGVVERLTLGNGRMLKAGSFAYLATEQIERTAKTHPGASAGLEKHGTENCALQHIRHTAAMGVRHHAISHLEDALDIIALKLSD